MGSNSLNAGKNVRKLTGLDLHIKNAVIWFEVLKSAEAKNLRKANANSPHAIKENYCKFAREPGEKTSTSLEEMNTI